MYSSPSPSRTRSVAPLTVTSPPPRSASQDILDAIKDFRVSLSADIAGVKSELKQVNNRLDGLDRRMDKLEGRMDKLEGRMDKLEGRMDRLEGRMSNVEGAVQSLHTRISEVEEAVRSLDTRMGTMENDIEALRDHVDGVEDRLTTAIISSRNMLLDRMIFYDTRAATRLYNGAVSAVSPDGMVRSFRPAPGIAIPDIFPISLSMLKGMNAEKLREFVEAYYIQDTGIHNLTLVVGGFIGISPLHIMG